MLRRKRRRRSTSHTKTKIIQSFVCFLFIFNLSDSSQRRNFCSSETTFIESGDQCIFVLDKVGNFAQNKQRCESRNATLLTINSIPNLEELCTYFSVNFPPTRSHFAYLNAYQDPEDINEYKWYHNNSRVVFPRDYWYDVEPTGLKCIELFQFEDFCKINDMICDKNISWAVCEIKSNPCGINNGNCDQICIARSFDTHVCKCEPGMEINNGTKCVNSTTSVSVSKKNSMKCASGFNIIRGDFTGNTNCVQFYEKQFPMSEAKRKCVFNSANLLTINEITDTRKTMCEDLQELEIYGTFWLDNPDSSNVTSHMACGSKLIPSNPLHSIYLILKRDTCCAADERSDKTETKMFICQIEEIDPCTRNNGDCGDLHCTANGDGVVSCGCNPGYDRVGHTCVDIHGCVFNNGGCHHICNDNTGRVICSCKTGYLLDTIYDTECWPLNQCEYQNGGCEQLCVSLGDAFFECQCRDGYDLYTTFSCIFNDTVIDDGNNTLPSNGTLPGRNRKIWEPPILLTLICILALVVVCTVISYIKKYKRKPPRGIDNKRHMVGSRVMHKTVNKRSTWV